jgi:hypothetical protein
MEDRRDILREGISARRQAALDAVRARVEAARDRQEWRRELLEDRKEARAERGEKPLSPQDKQRILGQIRGEARRQVESQFRGIMGQLDMSSLGKTPQERNANFKGLIDKTVSELAEERGFTLEELGASGRTPGKGASAQPGAAPGGSDALNSEMAGIDAAKHSGKTARDPDTGKRYRSDGKQWIPMVESNEY